MAQLAKTLFSPRGTIRKRDFWIGFAVSFGLLILSGLIDAVTEGAANRIGGLMLALVAQLVGLIIWFMIAIKRCRTLDQSPWLSLLLFIPFVGLIWLIVIGVQTAPEARGNTEIEAEAPGHALILMASWPAVAAAALAALAMVPLALHICIGVVSRYGLGAPIQLFAPGVFELVAVYGFIIVLVCGVVAFMMIDRGRDRRAERSGLGLALPLGLALAGIGAAIGFAPLPTLAWRLIEGVLGSYVFAGVAFNLFVVSAFARTPRMAACLSLPVASIPFAALIAEVSIIKAAAWMLLPLFVLGVAALFIGLSTPRRNDAVGLAIGAAIAIAYAVVLAPGLFTPTELSALVFVCAGVALGIMYVAGERQRLAAGLACASVNVAALAAAFIFAVALSQLWALSGGGAALAQQIANLETVVSHDAVAISAPALISAAMAVLACLATPLIALATLPLAIGALTNLGVGFEVMLPAAILGALAGFIIRLRTSARSENGNDRPAGLIILAGLALVLGIGANFLAPIGRFLARLLFY